MTDSIISHIFQGSQIEQRTTNGYINATQMCDANGKNFHDYFRLKATNAFLEELSETKGIPLVNLVISKEGRNGGTFVHPQVAINLGQWCSAKFAVWVTELVMNWISNQLVNKTSTELLYDAVGRLVEQEKLAREHAVRIKATEDKLESHAERIEGVEAEVGRFTSPHGHYYTIAGYAALIGVEMPHTQAVGMGRRAAHICRTMELPIEDVRDARYGTVHSYPESILQTLNWHI